MISQVFLFYLVTKYIYLFAPKIMVVAVPDLMTFIFLCITQLKRERAKAVVGPSERAGEYRWEKDHLRKKAKRTMQSKSFTFTLAKFILAM